MRESILRQHKAHGNANFAEFEFEYHAANVTTNVITKIITSGDIVCSNSKMQANWTLKLQLLFENHPGGLGHVFVTATG